MGADAEKNPFILWRRGQCPTPPVVAKEIGGEVPIGEDLTHSADGIVNYEGPSSTDRSNFAHGGDNID